MSFYNRFALYFGIAMSLTYVGTALFIFLRGEDLFSMSSNQKLIWSVLLAGYGLFRLSRYFINKKDPDHEPQNDN